MLDDRRGNLCRDGEADPDAAARGRKDRIVDADHIAGHVEQRAARIATVDGGVGLDVAVVGAPHAGVAEHRRDDPARNRAAQSEGVADRDHPVARARLSGIAEPHEGEGLASADLEHREIGFDIIADQFGSVFGAVGHGDGDLFNRAAARGADDVVVGHDIAVRRDEETGPQRLAFAELRFLLLLALAAVEQPFEGCAAEWVGTLHLDPLAGRDVDHRRLQLRGQIGKAFRSTGARHGSRHLHVVVLRHLRAGGVTRRQRHGGTANQQHTRQSIGISHWFHVLSFLFRAARLPRIGGAGKRRHSCSARFNRRTLNRH